MTNNEDGVEKAFKMFGLTFVFAFGVLFVISLSLLLYMLFIEAPAIGLSITALLGGGYLFARLVYPRVKDI